MPMEITTAELSREVEALVNKFTQYEPLIGNAADTSSATKKIVEEQHKSISKLESEKELLEKIIEEQGEDLKRQQLKHVEHQESIDKLFRIISELQNRLDGKTVSSMSFATYETVRANSEIIYDKLSGKGTNVTYDEIINTIGNTRFLGKVFSWFIGIFGVSGVAAVVLNATGVGSDSRITVQKLSGELSALRRDVDANVENFKEFKTSAQNNITKLYDRQWDALKK